MLGVIANQVAISLQNGRMYQVLEEQATTDGLTGLVNHRTFQERFTTMLGRAERHDLAVSLLLTDIDHFKKINDTYGHPTGDEVLRRVAAILKASARKIDIVARYGGEEFALVLEGTDRAGAVQLAERIRQEVEQQSFPSTKGSFKATLSIGIAGYPYDARDKPELIARADQALYSAKHGGRNRTVPVQRHRPRPRQAQGRQIGTKSATAGPRSELVCARWPTPMLSAAAAPAARRRRAGFEALRELLRCPRCKGPLTPPHNNAIRCADGTCARSYPVVMGKPVPIDEERSVFSHAEYLVHAAAPAAEGALAGVKQWLRWLPSPSVNMSAIRCLARMRDLLLGRGVINPVVLVVGGGLRGKGVSQLADAPGIPGHQRRSGARLGGGGVLRRPRPAVRRRIGPRRRRAGRAGARRRSVALRRRDPPS